MNDDLTPEEQAAEQDAARTTIVRREGRRRSRPDGNRPTCARPQPGTVRPPSRKSRPASRPPTSCSCRPERRPLRPELARLRVPVQRGLRTPPPITSGHQRRDQGACRWSSCSAASQPADSRKASASPACPRRHVRHADARRCRRRRPRTRDGQPSPGPPDRPKSCRLPRRKGWRRHDVGGDRCRLRAGGSARRHDNAGVDAPRARRRSVSRWQVSPRRTPAT